MTLIVRENGLGFEILDEEPTSKAIEALYDTFCD